MPESTVGFGMIGVVPRVFLALRGADTAGSLDTLLVLGVRVERRTPSFWVEDIVDLFSERVYECSGSLTVVAGYNLKLHSQEC